MDTDQLIRTLAADPAGTVRKMGYALMLALAATPVSLRVFTELGVGPDVLITMRNPFFDLKFALTLALELRRAVSLHHRDRKPKRPVCFATSLVGIWRRGSAAR
jgi:hypothetical protein